jgi:hypothetical protein
VSDDIVRKLKDVSQCYMTLQRCDGRLISVVGDFRTPSKKKKILFIKNGLKFKGGKSKMPHLVPKIGHCRK